MRVIAVAHDPGGANAVAATVLALRERGVQVEALAKGPAVRQFQRMGVACVPVPADHGAALERLEGDLLLMGTSAEDRFELDALMGAQQRQIPAVAVMDYWANYRKRFCRPEDAGRPPRLPEVITALDEGAARAMQAEGLPRERIRVMGQPYFGWLLERAKRGQRPRTPVRHVLFASQPDANEVEILRQLIPSLRALPALEQLLVRFHPRQVNREASLALLEPSGLPFAIDEQEDVLQTLQQQDRVLGITSVILIEAAMMGVPAASLVIGVEDTLETNAWGLTRRIDRIEQLPDFLAGAGGGVDLTQVEAHRASHAGLAEFCHEGLRTGLISAAV